MESRKVKGKRGGRGISSGGEGGREGTRGEIERQLNTHSNTRHTRLPLTPAIDNSVFTLKKRITLQLHYFTMLTILNSPTIKEQNIP